MVKAVSVASLPRAVRVVWILSALTTEIFLETIEMRSMHFLSKTVDFAGLFGRKGFILNPIY